jgi:hypothetical protein
MKRKPPQGYSYSDDFLRNRDSTPQVSALMAQGVSHYRKEMLAGDVARGIYKDGSGPSFNETGTTANANVVSLVGFNKSAQILGTSNSSTGGFRGNSSDTVKQIPEVYSPLWLASNLNLPRDRATINAWCRAFYALNPFVHNAINLHSTYPISKLTIKCPNPEIQKFFDDMIEELDLMNICVQIAQEYWLLGEAFVYAEYDNNKGKWSRIMIQNPDYMVVKRTVIANDAVIMLRPDENLKRIVKSNRPSDIEQRKQLNPYIVESVKRGENIQLPNFNASHIARKISPYEIRGTGLPVCIFRDLMLYDKIRECYSEDTEVLTDQGFKKIADLVQLSTDIDQNPNYVNGIKLDDQGQIASILTMRGDFKVACVNPQNNEVEYHKPAELHISQYSGEMIHFTGKKVDCLVSPNHKMWVKEKISGKWTNFEKKPAISLLDKKTNYKFLSKVQFTNNTNDPKEINILGKNIPIKLYLKVLGYLVSEGCVYSNFENGRYDALISVSQFTESDCYKDMKMAFEVFADKLNKNCSQTLRMVDNGYGDKITGVMKERWNASIHGKDIVEHFRKEIGTDGNTKSHYKRIPRWVMDLRPELMTILLDALVKGDGTEGISKYGTNSKNFKYSTVSKQLADDVYEMVYKIGFVPNLRIYTAKKSDDRIVTEYVVLWSDTNYGNEPNVMSSPKIGKNGGGARINKIDYTGLLWCIEVPTGLFITRRNGRITVQGNSKFAQADNMINPLTLVKIGNDGPEGLHPTFADLEAWRQVFEDAQFDKDFKIFTHPGVSVERVGHNQGIYDTSADITQLVKEIYVGLQVPPVLMDGGADTTYANGGVALDVLRQRYMQFRNMLSLWLKRKIFAPISHIQGFYDTKGGKKQLIIPEIDWNHMSLFDAGDYINTLVQLTQPGGGEGAPPPRVSLHTLYRSMGLEWEDEQRKIRKEAIQAEIVKKEAEALKLLHLTELRALDENEDIPEPAEQQGKAGGEQPVPGEVPGGAAPPMDLGGGLPGLSNMGPLGAPPPAPEGAPAEAAPPPPPTPPAGGPTPPG